jgi:hypothetical protein
MMMTMPSGTIISKLSRELSLASRESESERVDDADGFYRSCIIHPAGIPELGVIFPTKPGDEPVVAFPLQLTKG